MANVQLNPGVGGPFIATNPITRDNVTEEMEIVNLGDPTTGACAPVDAVNGVAVQVKTLPSLAAGTNNIGHVTVDTLPALPAGANNIGHVTVDTLPALPAGGNNIGHVTVDTLPTLPAGANNIGGVELLDGGGTNKLAIDTNGQIGTNTGPGSNLNGNGQFIPITDTTVKIDVAANGSQDVVAAVPGKAIYVTAYALVASEPSTGAGTVQFFDGTTSTALSGAMAVTPETGLSLGTGVGAILIVPAGDKLTVTCASGASVQGHLSYTQK